MNRLDEVVDFLFCQELFFTLQDDDRIIEFPAKMTDHPSVFGCCCKILAADHFKLGCHAIDGGAP